jgi:transcriptional regulator with XRE-family HTH domain
MAAPHRSESPHDPGRDSEAGALGFNYQLLSSELLRALRGRRSQATFARRLGYASNVAHNWEHGRSAPTAARMFWIARRLGVNLEAVMAGFYRLVPAWVARTDLTTREGVAEFLLDLKGQQSVVALAQSMGTTRFRIARWIAASTEPKLPEFLRFVEVASLRLLDFLALFVDPEQLPSVRTRWLAMQRARTLAYDAPWTQGVLRALELRVYRQRPHDSAWLGQRLGVNAVEIDGCLAQLASSRQIRWDGQHWQLETVRALDLGRDRVRSQRLRAWWGKVGVARAEMGCPGMVYNLFSVSRADLARLRLLQKQYLSELRGIVTESEPVECVVLAADLLIDLDALAYTQKVEA